MKGIAPLSFFIFVSTICLFSSLFISSVSAVDTDTLNLTQSLTRNQTLVSSGGRFELGFFSSGIPVKYYLGIWYKDIEPKTIVWVANRDAPVSSSSASLKLNGHGDVVILGSGSTVKWSSNQNQSSSSSSSDSEDSTSNPVVIQLLDTGNLVVRKVDDESPDNYKWQSFDNPTDTLLPGQKLGVNRKTGKNLFLTAWRGPNDPSSSNYTFKMDGDGDPEIFLSDGDRRKYRSGPWVGQRFSGVPEMKSSSALDFTFVNNQDVSYYMFNLVDKSIKSRLLVDSGGVLRRFTWVDDISAWNQFWYAPKDQCDEYRTCGPYGVCDASALFVCECPTGFTPKNEKSWQLRDASEGCVRKTNLDCETDGFLKLTEMKVPESGNAFVDQSMSLDQCREKCKKDCNCTAFANSHVVSGVGNGCAIWRNGTGLLDMRNYAEGGQDLYVRLSAADVEAAGGNGLSTTEKVLVGVGVTLGVGVLVFSAAYCMWKKKEKVQTVCKAGLAQRIASRAGITERSQDFLLSGEISRKRDYSGEANTEDIDLPLMDFDSLALATGNFSAANKLGQGGFGSVYKGVMPEGEEIAVKRLSKESGQGTEEFKNELKLIAKLQHRNLVRLLACCVDREEKMLVYEYLANRSLDSILFNKERRSSLDWQNRFNIICGIARGLLYLHQDSRFRIIHRDLKASNILLDSEMTPKISDFGMARIFGGDEAESNNTRRVVGTYGYMSPEYAMDGVFSVKSDVFSYGVLTLEIVTGTKNRGFFNSQNELNLLSYAWKMWKEGNGTDLLDQTIKDSCSIHEVLRCIQVGLLCVQERVEDRPTMSSVVLMLSSASASLPQPKVPGFCMGRSRTETDTSSSRQDETSNTVNNVTVTAMVDGR